MLHLPERSSNRSVNACPSVDIPLLCVVPVQISDMRLLNFHTDPHITKQPQRQSLINCGDSITLQVSAVGSGNLKYKWKKDGKEFSDSNCTGMDTSALTIISFSCENEGDYTVEVNNDHKTIESNSAKLELSK